MRERRERIAIAIDPAILRRIDEKAEQEGRSRSNYIERVLIKEIGEQYVVKKPFVR
jgi:metal-responsive CopG/Arc/MetJ family transcriptional regulator